MKKSKIVLNKLFLSLVLTIIMLSFGMVAFAANGPRLTVLQAGKYEGAKFTAVKNVTIYSNGNTDTSKGAVVEGCSTTPKDIVLDIKVVGPDGSRYLVSTKDRQIAKVENLSDQSRIRIVAGDKNGKTNIILADRYNLKKQFKITVTVKTLVNDITFGDNVKNGQINVAEKGNLNLDAVVNADASVKKLTYKVTDQNPNSAVKVSSKGVVTGLKPGVAKILITATDQKTKNVKSTGYSTSVKVVVSPARVKSMNVLNPLKDPDTEKYPVIEMKTNKYDSMHTFKIVAEAYGTFYPSGRRIANGVKFTSNKPSVVSVDSNGVLTALGNGKAKITISPAEGTKAAKAITLNVNVTTDLEDFSVIDNTSVLIGKQTKIHTYMDSAVTNKKLTFTLESFKAKDGSKDATVSLSSNGTVKGLKEGEATIRVESTPDKNGRIITRKCKVSVLNPVKSITATVTSLDKSGNEAYTKATTLYLNEKLQPGDQAFDKAKLKIDISFMKDTSMSKEVAMDYANVDISSSHWCVDIIKEGSDYYLIPDYPGKATITVTANDGSGKKVKISVTVKAKVNSIWLNGEGTHTDVSGVTCNSLYIPQGGSINLQEYVNYEASNKKVSFTLKESDGVVLSGRKLIAKKNADEFLMKAGTLIVSSNDATSVPKQKAFEKEYTVFIVQEPDENQLDCYLDGKTFKIEVGSENFNQYVSGNLGQELDLSWSSSNPKVVSVNSKGVAAFKGLGEAVITIEDKKSGKSEKAKVRVIESYKAFQDDLNNKMEYLINSGDYRFMGMKPDYNKKYPTSIGLMIVDGNKVNHEYGSSIKEDFNSLLDMFIDLFADPDYRSVEISDWNTYSNYAIERDGSGFRVSEYEDFNVLIRTQWYDKPQDATKALANLMTADYKTAYDYKDKSFSVDLIKSDHLNGYEDAEYYAYYNFYFNYDSMDVSRFYDDRIKEQLEAFDVRMEESGIGSIDFNESNKTVTINIADAAKEAGKSGEALKTSYVSALKEILKDSKEINICLEAAEGKIYDSFYFEETEEHLDSYVEKSYAEILESLEAMKIKASEKTEDAGELITLDMLENVTIRFTLSRYSDSPVEYNVTFKRTIYAIDKMLDQKIQKEVEEHNKRSNKDILGNVFYNNKTNELSVEVIDPEFEIDEMNKKSTGLRGIINIILSDNSATSARYISAGKKYFSEVKRNEQSGKLEIGKLDLYFNFMESQDRIMGDIIDRVLYIEVDYGGGKTITYAFYLINKIPDDSKNAVSDISDEEVPEEVTGEAEIEEEIIEVEEEASETTEEETSEEIEEGSLEGTEEMDEAVIEDSSEEYEEPSDAETGDSPEIKEEADEPETELVFVTEVEEAGEDKIEETIEK